MIVHPLVLQKVNQVAELVARPDLGCRQGDGRSTVDTVLHRVPDALGDVEEMLLKMPALGTHATGGSVRSLTKRL
jgi:hypothetical protein